MFNRFASETDGRWGMAGYVTAVSLLEKTTTWIQKWLKSRWDF
jgi:hypothetical protein